MWPMGSQPPLVSSISDGPASLPVLLPPPVNPTFSVLEAKISAFIQHFASAFAGYRERMVKIGAELPKLSQK